MEPLLAQLKALPAKLGKVGTVVAAAVVVALMIVVAAISLGTPGGQYQYAFTNLTAEHYNGRDAFVSRLKTDRERILAAEKSNPGEAVVHKNLADMKKVLAPNVIVYQKGGWVLHMLRGQIGTEKFWQGIRDYYHRYRDSNASSAVMLWAMSSTIRILTDGCAMASDYEEAGNAASRWAMIVGERTSSTAPRAIAARGMVAELAVCGSCTHATPPSARITSRPCAPSSFAPDSRMPSSRDAYTCAADSNMTSIDGRE